MAFLTISGFEIPISAGGVSLNREAYGRQSVSYGGAQQPQRWGTTRAFDLSTPVTTRAKARALSGLIAGDGHSMPFDSTLYSSTGLGPNPGYGITMSATGGAVGGYVQVTGGQSLTYTFKHNFDRTMMVCKYDGAAWNHYALTYDYSTAITVQYKNGAVHTPVVGDDINNFFSYNSTFGYWQLEGKNSAGVASDSRYDQLVIAPYVMSADMIAAFDTEILTAGLSFSPIPLLRVSGDMIPDGPQLYVGSTSESEYQVAAIASGDLIALDLSFTLTEYQARLT